MKFLFFFGITIFISLSIQAQRIMYEFAAPNAIHHEAEISITVDDLPAGPAVFRMSRSSPGRYAKHEFGKNVYNVSARDENGKSLLVTKTDADVYQVTDHKGTIKLSYTLYGNYADGTYASIDATNFHLNMPATFIWIKGFDNIPIKIHFTLPKVDWKVATQLKQTSEANTFTAPGLQYFMDSPTKIGDLHFREWQVTNPDKKVYIFRLALDAKASEKDIDDFSEKLQRLVKEEQAVYGELPAYDYGMYTFIASINPYVRGDGMEHRNSTMITVPINFSKDNNIIMELFAHEFFHCWNVERIRPKSIEPFNFEKSNMSEALWVAEGFTEYYGNLLTRRAGYMTDEEFDAVIAKLINAKINTPGGANYTPIENSERAVFVDAGVSIDRTNYENMYTSYYNYGGALALMLDLNLRNNYNKSLDDFMKEMWKRFGKNEKAYNLPEMQEALGAVIGDATAAKFFHDFVYDHASPSYQLLLQKAGLVMQRQYAGRAWIGKVSLTSRNNSLIVSSNTVINRPLYEAGVDIGDVIVKLDGRDIQRIDEIQSVLEQHKPGDKIALLYKHQDELKDTTMALSEDPTIMIESLDEEGKLLSDQQHYRESWLESHVK
jgi:predicted metalloprotease with PDZ domain